jgi:tetrahydromethanopterin S-methyltransferase subunit E
VTTLRLGLIGVLFLAILHMLTVRVGIAPGVHMPIAGLVLGAEVAAVAIAAWGITRQLGRFRSSATWRSQAA